MQDCYVLNHNCGFGEYAREETEMLYFFGILIGYGILSCNPLPLNLHPIFWKSVLSSEELNDGADLRLLDKYSWQMLNTTEEKFAETFEEQKFTLIGENEKVIELCPGGASM